MAYFGGGTAISAVGQHSAGWLPSTDDGLQTAASNYATGGIKRAMDLIVTLCVLSVAIIPMLIIAILIKLDSRGPIFYKQMRRGIGETSFLILKFRSMRDSRDAGRFRQAELNDDRITPVGRFIRKTSLDELPQLFNVLMGHMSLVGPRPHPRQLDETFESEIESYSARFRVRPGMTGLAQVSGARGATPTVQHMARRIALDIEYTRKATVWRDLAILAATAREVVASKHAF